MGGTTAAWYALAWLAVFLLAPQPRLRGAPGVEALTAAGFRELVARNAAPGGGGGGEDRAAAPSGPPAPPAAWFLMLESASSADCTAAAPVMAALAAAHGGPGSRLRFGTLDVAAWPAAARLLRVDAGSGSPQLPTWVLFDAKGAEVGRLPRPEASQRYVWKAKELAAKFELAAHAAAPAAEAAGRKEGRHK